MTPTKEQIRRVLALPLGWRRRLASNTDPGWWCRIEEDGRACAKLYEGPRGWGAFYTVSQGWAWLPCCALSWCAAAGLVPAPTTDAHAVIDAALTYMEAHEPPEQS